MADESSVTAARRGRPPVEHRLSHVSTRLPEAYHDRLIKLAQQQEKSVSALVRDLLTLKLR